MRLFKINDFSWAIGKAKAKVGEIHDWGGKKMQKMPDGKWAAVAGEDSKKSGDTHRNKLNEYLERSKKRVDALALATVDLDSMAGEVYDFLDDHGDDIADADKDKIIDSIHGALKEAEKLKDSHKWDNKEDIERWRKGIENARDVLSDAWQKIHNAATGEK